MLITLSKNERSLCTIDMTERDQTSTKMIKHVFFENLAKIANLGKAKNENFKCHISHGKHFIMSSFNILSGLRHITDQINHLWKSPLFVP